MATEEMSAVAAPGGTPPETALIVGSGLMGTSVALALRAVGVHTWLADRDAGRVAVAAELGAGERWRNGLPPPDLVVVAVPPFQTGVVVAAHLRLFPKATVIDLASIKARPLVEVTTRVGPESARYLGTHPLAGSEASGPRAARIDLFAGRPWVLTPGPDVSATALRLGVWLASACGASPVQMSPDEHDRAVAFTSHLPQLIAYALAAQAGFNERLQPQLVGQGLRDMTRIARSDPGLWVEIASGNHRWVRTALEAFDRRIHSMIAALPDDPATVAPAADQLRVLFEEGVSGASRLPGKHGGTGRSFVAVSVFIPDSPGQLAALFTAVGEAGINIEDVRIAHAPTAPGATVEVFVTPAAVGELRQVLHRAGWPTAT